MFGQTKQLWVGLGLVLLGAVLLFANFILGINTPLVLLAAGVLILAVGTLIIGITQRERPV
ncbi:hypothetical protein [Haladaptatus sp. CMAA 1911]|uniref:hypothetical protein n=1 Tax=unclassified Haladaptatus TaxID=2622732 RepID=UPI0037544169